MFGRSTALGYSNERQGQEDERSDAYGRYWPESGSC